MDSTGVPKKINRHVYKALQNSRSITLTKILRDVKYSMRNLVPVENFEEAVRRSLYNFQQNGLVYRQGNSFTLSERSIHVKAIYSRNSANDSIEREEIVDETGEDKTLNSIHSNLQKLFRNEQKTLSERKGKLVDLSKTKNSLEFIATHSSETLDDGSIPEPSTSAAISSTADQVYNNEKDSDLKKEYVQEKLIPLTEVDEDEEKFTKSLEEQNLPVRDSSSDNLEADHAVMQNIDERELDSYT